MPFQPPYLVTAKNLKSFLEALRHAQAPEKVTVRFIEQLGFKSTNDRLFVPLLKAMKFTDDAGKPSARYHSFLDDSEWETVLSEGVRDAYADLFRINRKANEFTREQLTGKMKSLGEGKLSMAVLNNAVRTFLELVKLADFAAITAVPAPEMQSGELAEVTAEEVQAAAPSVGATAAPGSTVVGSSLVYRIEIVLPAVRDQAVYDAIFRSAREHLLK